MASAIPAPRRGASRWKPLALFSVAAMLSAGVIGAAFGLLGHVVSPLVPAAIRWALLLAAAVLLTLLDLSSPQHTPSTPFQTKKEWRRLGARVASIMWGLHLGLGVATVRSTSALWMLLLAEALLGYGLAFGLAVGVAYGVGLAMAVLIGQRAWVSVDADGRSTFRTHRALSYGRVARLVVSGAMVLWLAVTAAVLL